jgi:hypothetical protein
MITKTGKIIDNVWGSTINSLRRLAFKRFYQNKETAFIDLSNFDNTPKGTGALFIPKDLFIKTALSIDYENKHVSDDTKLLFSLAKGGGRIYLNPHFKFTYLQRSGFWENVIHLYQRGPKFVDYYYGRHTTYTLIITLGLIFPLLMVGLVWLHVLSVAHILLILLCLHTGFAVAVGKDIRKKCILLFLFPIIALSLGCGVVKGLWIIVWRKIKTAQLKLNRF